MAFIPKNQSLPHPNDDIFIVRISERKGAENARNDYQILVNALYSSEEDWKKFGVWDKDSKNKIKPKSWLGFIVGKIGNEIVELYYIEKEMEISYRLSHWCSDQSYTDQYVQSTPETREIVILKKQNIVSMPWKEWKQRVGYKEKYTPRGTIKSKNPF